MNYKLVEGNISGIFVFAFGHQGSSNGQKMRKIMKIPNNIFPVHNLLE